MRTVCLVVFLGLGVPAFAQEAASPPQAASLPQPASLPKAADIDEVIVPGRTPENLRVEIERVEVAVYERFNALNSNDEFDIHCLMQAPTGSNIPLRTCAPNFVIRAESHSAEKMVTDSRSRAGNNNNPAEHDLRMKEKSRELTEEIQRVAREDEQLLRDLVRLDELKQLQASEDARPAKR